MGKGGPKILQWWHGVLRTGQNQSLINNHKLPFISSEQYRKAYFIFIRHLCYSGCCWYKTSLDKKLQRHLSCSPESSKKLSLKFFSCSEKDRKHSGMLTPGLREEDEEPGQRAHLREEENALGSLDHDCSDAEQCRCNWIHISLEHPRIVVEKSTNKFKCVAL